MISTINKCLFNLLFLIIIITFFSCKNENESDYNEDDYYKAQGIIIKVNTNFSNFHRKFSNNYVYAYRLDLSEPLIGFSDSEFVLRNNEPLVIMVNKKDSLDSFIAHRGIIDKKTLAEFKENLKVNEETLQN